MNIRIGQYAIAEKLGQGGMGEVFRAEDTRLRRQVALKLLSSELSDNEAIRARFLREARAASALNHPNVCMIYDIGESEDGRPYLALELIEGDNLADLIGKTQFEIARIVDIATQVASALEAAHEKGIVHRDIKPGNISIGHRGQVKVLDFGLAKQLGEDDPLQNCTRELQMTTSPGTLLGTPAYMSPEQAVAREVDARSDLFSLGAVIYHLLTGRAPFGGANLGELLNNVVHRQPEPIARLNYNVPPELERITLKLLAKDPDRRYQSARDLVVDLKNLRRALEHESEPIDTFRTVDRIREAFPHGESYPASGESPAAPTAEDISHSDVVIAYASLDDKPMIAGRQGWISKLHENLQLRVAQLSGRQVAVVKQVDPSSSPTTEAEVLRQVPQAKTVVSVLSPPFAHSNGCHKVVETFWRTAEQAGAMEVANRSRLLNVVKTPVDDSELPDQIRPLFERLVPYEFFERNTETGRLREFDEAFGELATQRFHERVYDVAYDISQVLKYIGEAPTREGRRTTEPKTIYLAMTTSDLEPQRDQLRRELVELGHDVLPKQPLPLVAGELVHAVQRCLEQADLAIHFVGERYGFVPEATELSVVALQNQIAAQCAQNTGLRRLIWLPKGMQPQDDRQHRFIRQLETDADSLLGAELIADTLENLKELLRSRWQREQAANQNPVSSLPASAAPRVYLICDQRDEESVEALQDYFYEQGIEVSLPGFEADESEVQQIHIQNLRDCDAALIYYGEAGMHWVDFKIRDLQKAAGYRDSRPIPVNAVFVGPPFNRRKERFKSVTVDVIRQADEKFDPGGLAGFVQSLRGLKEAE